MQKPHITRQLTLYSAICAGLAILLQSAAAVLPVRVLLHTNVEIAGGWRALLLGVIWIKLLPMCGTAVWSYCSSVVTKQKAMLTVILAPVLYVAGILVENGSCLVLRFFTELEVVAAFSTAQNYGNLFSVLGTASLVLLCCAGAVECYITKSAPSDGERKEVTL